MIYFKTDRLIFRDWKNTDLELFINMNADKEVMKYFPDTLTRDESEDFFNLIKDEFVDRGYGLYAVELKDSGEFIGYIGFHLSTFKADFTPCVEIGWRLRKEFWGKGYATEGALSCLEYGFNTLGFKDIYSFTAVINTLSENVMKRIGLSFIKHFDHPKVEKGLLVNHVLYHINGATFDEYRKSMQNIY